jgi:O-acetyl-ADP-ribose deacetylase (regulator of RNase III)
LVEYKFGDILEADEKYITHQCNCLTTSAGGLAKAIFDRFPYSDTYSDGRNRDKKGKISVHGNGQSERYIINMYAQVYPGASITISEEIGRKNMFQKCLKEIEKIKDLESIAFPYRIGCGIAGGNWDEYLKMIEDFEERVRDFSKVVIYKFE